MYYLYNAFTEASKKEKHFKNRQKHRHLVFKKEQIFWFDILKFRFIKKTWHIINLLLVHLSCLHVIFVHQFQYVDFVILNILRTPQNLLRAFWSLNYFLFFAHFFSIEGLPFRVSKTYGVGFILDNRGG